MLTEAGRQAAARVSRARAAVLERSLAVLSEAERETFEFLAGKVLVGMMRGPGATRWICRLCDIGVCRGAEGGCPVGNAARERYSAADRLGTGQRGMAVRYRQDVSSRPGPHELRASDADRELVITLLSEAAARRQAHPGRACRALGASTGGQDARRADQADR